MKYVFVDTNIFLHFQDFKTIDWLHEVSDTECAIIIAPIVIDELDEKKKGTNKISNRARQVLIQFESYINERIISDNIYFEIQLDKPLANIYEENNLNFNEQDHRLIASMIDFRQKRNVNNIVICSNDIGPRLRAKQFGFDTLKLSEKYLIPIQESEEEKKIKRLEEENRKLKNRIPDLSLKFDNSNDFIKFYPQNIESVEFKGFKAERMLKIKLEHPYIEQLDPYKNYFASLKIDSLESNQINEYNKKLDDYYLECEKTLYNIFEQEIRKELTFEITLMLINSGTVPAEDIDLYFHFPDGFELVESYNIQNIIELPEPPYRPKHRFDHEHYYAKNFFSILPDIKIGDKINSNGPSIKKTNSYDVDFYREQLKHGYTEKLERLSLIFKSYSEIKNFNIEYEISAGNIPDKLNGILNVIFEKGNEL